MSSASSSNANVRVLVVEDAVKERRALSLILKNEGFTVFSVENEDKAASYIDEDIAVVLSDLYLGDGSGLNLLNLWKRSAPRTQFILITGHADVASAVEAMRAGAYDYVTKPINRDELVLLITRAVNEARKEMELQALRRRLDQRFGLDGIIGQSRQMNDVFERIQRAAPVDSTVLILGESGTGKELVAQALHQNSRRKDRPFVAVNCAAVPATLVESELFGHVRGAFTGATDRRIGRFEQADGGTLFIDEIGDFELGLQAKLLRVLESLTLTPVGGHEDRKVDVRVVAATSRDIRDMVAQGTFREDLFYRLNVVQIQLPPLRHRIEDIPLLIEYFLKEIAQQKHTASRRVSPAVVDRLTMYQWPGNVRELRNVLESMMVLADDELLTEHDLPERFVPGRTLANSTYIPPGVTLDQLMWMAISRALEECKGNRTDAAQMLGVSVRTLQRKLERYAREGRSLARCRARTRPKVG